MRPSGRIPQKGFALLGPKCRSAGFRLRWRPCATGSSALLLPERLVAEAQRLGAGDADILQQAVVHAAELVALAQAATPDPQRGDKGLRRVAEVAQRRAGAGRGNRRSRPGCREMDRCHMNSPKSLGIARITAAQPDALKLSM